MVSQTDVARDRLLDAACDLIVDGGPAAANVSAIATRADVSRMTVYRKFSDRRALLAELFNRELGAIVTAAVATAAPDQRRRVVQAITDSVAGINAHPLMRSVLHHEPELLTPWVTQRLGVTGRLARSLLREQITAGQPGTGDGSIRPGDPDEMSLTLVLVAQTFIFSQRIGGSSAELRRLVDGYLT